jgi:hypothetical protein
VVEVEAAQEVLVRLAGSAVLGRDHAGYRFQSFACSKDGAGFQVDPTDDALGGADRFAN